MGKFSGSWPVLVLCVMDCLPGALSLPTKKNISTGWMLNLKDVIRIMGKHFSCEGAFINEIMC